MGRAKGTLEGSGKTARRARRRRRHRGRQSRPKRPAGALALRAVGQKAMRPLTVPVNNTIP